MNTIIKNMEQNVGTHGSCVQSGSCVRYDTPMYRKRKNIRAEFHDYSGGEYFVTICTRDKHHYFGRIEDGKMLLTAIGEYCKLQLEEVAMHYPYAEIPLFVVMPNHLHAIICINSDAVANRTHEPAANRTHDTAANRTHEPCVPTNATIATPTITNLTLPAVRTALSVVVGGLKRAVTMFARRNNIVFGWQSRYHDHIIRGIADGNRIADYIENNVARWHSDCFNK